MEAVIGSTRNYLKINDHEVEKCIECLVHCDEVEEVEEEKTSTEAK